MLKQLGRTAWLGALILGVFTLAPARADDKKAEGKIRVLIIDGQNNHNWRATTPFMKKALEDCGRFTVDVATSPEKLNRPGKPKVDSLRAKAAYEAALAKYEVALPAYKKAMEAFQPDISRYDVVLSNYNGDAWSPKLQAALEEYVKSGKGSLVIVHAANNSFGSWLEYNRMIGMGWRGNGFGDRLTLDHEGKEKRIPKGKGPGSGHGAGHAFLITIRDPEHPITKGMPSSWMHARDELYHGMRGPIEHVRLLATAYSDRSKGGTGEHEPMIWTVTYGKGRVFHTPMGHDLTGMRCVGFITTLRRGTEWAATGKVTIPIPENFPTETKASSVPAK
jgi:type 1 glutamine amidotransferase